MENENQTQQKATNTEIEQPRQTPFKASTSATICKIVTALARAQGKYKPLIKNCEGTVNYPAKDGRPAGSYTFEYADLSAVIEATSAALSGEELCHTALIGGGIIRVMLMHSSGEWISSEAALASTGSTQQLGSQITYLRRYLLSPLLGVASEDDDDANSAVGNRFNKTEKQSRQASGQRDQKTQEQPKPGSAKEQSKTAALVDLLAKAGKDKPADALAWMSKRLGRDIKATKELTSVEVEQLITDATALAKEVA